MDDDERPIVSLRRRTDAERLDYFMMEVATLSSRVQQQEREIIALRRRVNRLEERLEERDVTSVTKS